MEFTEEEKKFLLELVNRSPVQMTMEQLINGQVKPNEMVTGLIQKLQPKEVA